MGSRSRLGPPRRPIQMLLSYPIRAIRIFRGRGPLRDAEPKPIAMPRTERATSSKAPSALSDMQSLSHGLSHPPALQQQNRKKVRDIEVGLATPGSPPMPYFRPKQRQTCQINILWFDYFPARMDGGAQIDISQ